MRKISNCVGGVRSAIRGRSAALSAAVIAVAAAIAPVAVESKASAQTYTWANPGNGVWSDPANWVEGVSPVGDVNAQLVFNAGSYVTDSAGNQTLNRITINNNPGNTIDVAGFSTLMFAGANPQIVVNGGHSVFTNSQLGSISGFQVTNAGSGTMTIGSVIYATGETVFANTGSGTLTLQDSGTVALFSQPNAVITLANTGSGVFNMGNLTAAPQILNTGVAGTVNIVGGVVKASNTGGDLFFDTLLLNVAAGATFDFNNNGESMGGLSGDGKIINGTAGITMNMPGNRSFGGFFQGTADVTHQNSGTLTITNDMDRSGTWSGNFILGGAGRVLLGADNAFAHTPLIIIAGDLDLNGLSPTIAGLAGRNLSGPLNLGSGTLTIAGDEVPRTFSGNLTGTGNLVINGLGVQSFLGSNSFTGRTTVSGGTYRTNFANIATTSGVTVSPTASLTVITPGDVSWTATNVLNTGNFTKEGAGTLTFATPSTAMGITSFRALTGPVVIDRSVSNLNALTTSPTLALTVGTASVSLKGNGTAASTQTFSGTALEGAAKFRVTTGSGQAASIALGAITRNPSLGSTLDVSLTNVGGGSASVTTTSANNAAGTLGGYATFNGGREWARVSGGSIVGGATYATNNWAANTHTDVTANFTTPSAGTTADVRFNLPAANTVTLSGATTVTFGGILVTPDVGANNVLITNTASSTLRSPANQDLIIQQFNTAGTLTIAAPINNVNGTAVAHVASTLTTTANSQSITVDSLAGITLGARVTGGAFSSTANAHVVSIDSPTKITIAYQTAPTTTSSNTTLTFTPGLNLVKAGPGRLILTAANTFAGVIVANEGTIQVGAANTMGVSANTGSSSMLFDGGTVDFTATINPGSSIQHWMVAAGGGTLNIAPNLTVTKQGNSFFGTGDIKVTGGGTLSIGSNLSTFIGNFDLINGIFQLTSNQVRFSQGVIVRNGSQFLLNDTTSGPFNVGPGGSLILNGDGPSSGGAYRHILGEAGSSNWAFNSPVVLETSSRFVILNRGSDTATDTFPLPISGPGNLIKDGDGTMVISSPSNTYAGATILRNGTLRTGVANAFPAATTLTFGEPNSVESTTLNLNGFSQTVGGLTSTGLATDHRIINATANPLVTLRVNYNGASNQIFTGKLGAGDGSNLGLTKSGTGTLSILGETSFTGPVSVEAGNLRLAESNTARDYSVSDGATLTLSNLAGSAVAATSFTVGSTASSNLAFEINGSIPGSGFINVATPDALTLNGIINIAIASSQQLSVGTLPLIRYSGTAQGAGLAAFTGTLSLPSHVFGTLVFNSGSIDLNITSVNYDFLRWKGNVNSNWDIATTPNFILNSDNSVHTYSDLPSPDAVTFDDSVTGSRNVNITTTVNPDSYIVSGTGDYTFSGTGFVAGSASFTKNGTGTATILTNNVNTGDIVVNGGTVNVGNGGTTGLIGSGKIVNAGTINFNRSNDSIVPGNITNAGTILKQGAGTLNFTGVATLGGTTTISGGALGLQAGTVTGLVTASAAGSLIKSSVGILNVTGTIATSSNIQLNAGIIQIGDGGGSGQVLGNIVSTAGSTLRFARDNYTHAGDYTGGGSLAVTTGYTILTGSLGYTGTTFVGPEALLEFGSNSNFDLVGAITGGNIIKSGLGTGRILGRNPLFLGELTVNGGTFQLVDTGVGADINVSTITINDTGKFMFGQGAAFGGITGENPDLPDTTVGIINTGGTWEQRIGENFGALSLRGGTLTLNGGNTTLVTDAAEFAGLDAQSGFITGPGAGGTINVTNAATNVGAGVTKTTTGTVTVTGIVNISSAVPIVISEGKMSFTSPNLPITGTGTLKLGGGPSTAMLEYADAPARTIARPITIDNDSAISVTNPSAILTLSANTSGGGSLRKVGPGTLAIAGTASYNGNVTIDEGTLAVPNNTTARGYSISDAATLRVGFASGPPVTANTLAFGAGTGILALDFAGSIPATGSINVINSDGLSTAGSAFIRITTGQTPTLGTVPLITYSGSIGGSGFSGFQPLVGIVAPFRITATLEDNAANHSIDLNISSIDTVKWSGAISSAWDINTTANFFLGTAGTPTTYLETPIADNPIFDDTAAGTHNVNLTTALRPTSVTVDTTVGYTFSGTGNITGATGLTKAGPGTLTLTTDNTYAGLTLINDGTVQLGSGGTTGNIGLANVSIAPTGTLAVNRSNDLTLGQLLTGSGTIAKTGSGTLTLTAANTGFIGGLTIDGGAVVLADIAGSGGDINAASIVINNTGAFVIGQGNIVNENPDLPNTTIITVNPGGLLETRVGETFGAITLNGGTMLFNGQVGDDLAATTGPVTGLDARSGLITTTNVLTGSASITAVGNGFAKTTSGTVTVTGAIAIGATTAVKVSEGLLDFQAANFPAGGTAALTLGTATTAGTIRLSDNGLLSVTRPVILAGAGTIEVATAPSTITFDGAVSGTGSLTKAGPGTLTITNSATYTGNTTVTGGLLNAQQPLRPGTGTLVVSGPGAAAHLNAPATLLVSPGYTVAGQFAGISVTDGTVLVPTIDRSLNKATVVVTDAISITGGTVDLGDSDLIVKTATLTDLRTQLATGHLLASAASPTSAPYTTLVLFSNDDAGSPFYSTYDGLAVTSTTAIVKYSYIGDTNIDGVLNGTDAANIIESLSTGVYLASADTNYDGVVNITDWLRFSAAWGNTGPSLGDGQGASNDGGSVPEPSALGLLLAVAPLVTRRRRVR